MKNTTDLSRGMTETIILKLLACRPMYGYEIIKVVLEKTDGRFQWKEGTLYPCLHRLEESKLIESYWELSAENKPRKYYKITRSGLEACQTGEAEVREFCRALTMLFA